MVHKSFVQICLDYITLLFHSYFLNFIGFLHSTISYVDILQYFIIREKKKSWFFKLEYCICILKICND